MVTDQLFQSQYMTLKVEDSIMVIIYSKELTIDLEVAKQMVKERLSVFNNNNYPVLVDARYIKYATKEARDHFAKEDGVKGITALAILIGNYLTATMANLYIKFSKPPIQTKVFNTRDQAVKWLKQLR